MLCRAVRRTEKSAPRAAVPFASIARPNERNNRFSSDASITHPNVIRHSIALDNVLRVVVRALHSRARLGAPEHNDRAEATRNRVAD
jgi:hypothetical protein